MWQTFSLRTMKNEAWKRNLDRSKRDLANGISLLTKPRLRKEAKINWKHFNYLTDPWELDVVAAFVKRTFCYGNSARIMSLGQAEVATKWFLDVGRKAYGKDLDNYASRIHLLKLFRPDLLDELYHRMLRIV